MGGGIKPHSRVLVSDNYVARLSGPDKTVVMISRSLEVATLSFYREVELNGDATSRKDCENKGSERHRAFREAAIKID